MEFNTDALVKKYEKRIDETHRATMTTKDRREGIAFLQKQNYVAEYCSWLPSVSDELEQVVNDAWQTALLNMQAKEIAENTTTEGTSLNECVLLTYVQKSQLKKVEDAVSKVFKKDGGNKDEQIKFLQKQYQEARKTKLEEMVKGSESSESEGVVLESLRPEIKAEREALEELLEIEIFMGEYFTFNKKAEKHVSLSSFIDDQDIEENEGIEKVKILDRHIGQFSEFEKIIEKAQQNDETIKICKGYLLHYDETLDIDHMSNDEVFRLVKEKKKELDEIWTGYKERFKPENVAFLKKIQKETDRMKKDRMLVEAVKANMLPFPPPTLPPLYT